MGTQGMNAGDLCRRDLSVGFRSMTLDEVARVMRSDHAGCLVIVDETARGPVVAGLLTDRDIVSTVVARNTLPSTLRAADVMNREVVCVRDDVSLADTLSLMQRRRVRRLPVVGPQQNLLGVLTADDLLHALTTQVQSLARSVSEQAPAEAVSRP